MANQFLIKETMAAMKVLSAAEITALQVETYDGVQLLGYYEKGDTPAPIVYYYMNPLTDPDPGVDDGVILLMLYDIFKTFFLELILHINRLCLGKY